MEGLDAWPHWNGIPVRPYPHAAQVIDCRPADLGQVEQLGHQRQQVRLFRKHQRTRRLRSSSQNAALIVAAAATHRKFRIQIAADSYSSFLKGIGFGVPMAAPVLGVSSGRVQAGPLPGRDVFRMTIAREDLNHPAVDLMAAYGFYIVSRGIRESSAGNDPDSKERISDAIWLFANYYRCSFNGKLTDYYRSSQNIEKWNSALWGMRAKDGADAMYKAMFIATQQWKPFGSIDGDLNFDNYYSLRILADIIARDNNSEAQARMLDHSLSKEGYTRQTFISDTM